MIKPRRMRYSGHACCMERNSCKVSVGQTEEERPLGNLDVDGNVIKINFREIWWDDVDWVILIRDKEKWRAVVITVMNLRVHTML
jgi:hypothetical protein